VRDGIHAQRAEQFVAWCDVDPPEARHRRGHRNALVRQPARDGDRKRGAEVDDHVHGALTSDHRRAIRGTRRITVAPPTDIFTPLRLHGPHHGHAGENTDVVATRAKANRQLGSRSPAFEPVGSP